MKVNMTNEEKAKEIAVKWKAKGLPYNAIYDSCLEIVQWKDEQFKESVNKAMKRLEINLELTEAESTHIRKLFNF